MKQLIEIPASHIINEILVCPYCMNEVGCEVAGCCGEHRGHFEIGYVTLDQDVYLKSEVRIVNLFESEVNADETEIIDIFKGEE